MVIFSGRHKESILNSHKGISSAEAKKRLTRYGANLLKPPKRTDIFTLLISQFKSPIIIILFVATGLVSGLLGFWQERGASNAIEKLLSIVQIKAAVLRDGSSIEIPIEQIVPGDIVVLNAGDIIPGDGLVQESKDLFVDEAMLTGETFPVEKEPAVLPQETPLAQRTNTLWMGTHVVSGSATQLIVRTGRETYGSYPFACGYYFCY